MEALKQDIAQHYRVGDRLPPLRQMARRHDVSTTTMGQALMILAYTGWVQPVQGSGFYVCEPATQRPIAVLLDLDIGLASGSHFWPRVAQHVRQMLNDRGETNRLYVGFNRPHCSGEHETCPDLLADLTSGQIRAIVSVWGTLNRPWAFEWRRRGIPMVGFGSGLSVRLDLEGFVRDAVRRLVGLGRRRIALLSWLPEGETDPLTGPLVTAFAAELAREGVGFRPDWVRGHAHPTTGGAGWEEFREIWLSSSEKPDGLVVTDEVLLDGVDEAMGQMGLRPSVDLMLAAQITSTSILERQTPTVTATADPETFAAELVVLLLAQLDPSAPPPESRLIPVRWLDADHTATSRRPAAMTTESSHTPASE